MFLGALIIFGMVLGIFSGIYENCLRAEKDFRGHLGSWESNLIFAVESVYFIFVSSFLEDGVNWGVIQILNNK